MKKIIASLTILCFFTAVKAQHSDMDDIKKVNQEWLNSYLKKDTMTLSRIFSNDMILVTSLGVTLRKADVFARMMEPDRRYLSITLDSIVDIRLIGKTGVLIAKSTIIRSLTNVESTIHNCYMIVLEKKHEKWVISAIHVTVLSTK